MRCVHCGAYAIDIATDPFKRTCTDSDDGQHTMAEA